MSTETTTPNTVATKEQAESYIQDALINGKLEMKQACKDLGWSFPRIRSKAKTIAKRLNGEFVKDVRGVYYLQTGVSTDAQVQSEAEVAETKPTAAEVETAVMQNLETPSENTENE